MSRIPAKLGTVTIPNGQANSTTITNADLNNRVAFGSLVSLLVFAPAALTNACSVYVTAVNNPSASDWRQLQIGGASVSVGAGQAVEVPTAAIAGIQIRATGNEAADRIFEILGQHDI